MIIILFKFLLNLIELINLKYLNIDFYIKRNFSFEIRGSLPKNKKKTLKEALKRRALSVQWLARYFVTNKFVSV